MTQPALDYSQRFARLVEYLLFGHEISCAEFAERSERIVDDLRSNDATKNILNGVYLPFCLPKVKINDYGKVLDGMFLTAVGQSYKAQFPHRSFNNYRKGKLTKQVGIVSGSRHERLVEAMSRGIVVGLYFPNCLQGFSVNADHEQMAGLSEKFLLAGGFDAATAMVAYPDILARDVKTPLLDLASLQRQSAQDSLYFRAYDDHLNFDYGSGLGDTHGSFAGGLVVLG